jgi:hypothetical protein
MSDHSESLSQKSMGSFMEALYGDNHSEYLPNSDSASTDQLPDFIQFLIDRLVELCVTQEFAENIRRTLNPWIRELGTNPRSTRMVISGFMEVFMKLFRQETEKINKYG